MSNVSKLFTEMFRPQKLDMLIAPERIKSQLNKGLIQNILLEGPPGTGKTSTAYILAGGRNNPNCMYVNASSDGRQEIIPELVAFCSTVGLFAAETSEIQKKVIIFDEVDGASTAFFNSMKSFIEAYEPTTRFIMTCNTISKVPDAIQSRMNVIKFKPTPDEEEYILSEYIKRVGTILTHIKVEYTNESITKFVKSSFPDMRALMNKIQTIHISGITELNEQAMLTTYTYKELYEMCVTPPSEIDTYKLVQSNYSSNIQECMVALGDEFVEFLREFHPEKLHKIPSIIVNVADYQHKLSTVIDGSIALQALIFTIQNILK